MAQPFQALDRVPEALSDTRIETDLPLIDKYENIHCQ